MTACAAFEVHVVIRILGYDFVNDDTWPGFEKPGRLVESSSRNFMHVVIQIYVEPGCSSLMADEIFLAKCSYTATNIS